MNGLSRFKISGFRRLKNFELSLRPLTVAVGANGVGKTTLLDGFDLLSAAAGQTSLNHTLSELGGLAHILTRGRADEISLVAETPVEGAEPPQAEPLKYELSLRPAGPTYDVAREVLSQVRPGHNPAQPFKHIDSAAGRIRYYSMEDGGLTIPTWEHDPRETSLAQVPKLFRQPEDLRRLLAKTARYGALDVSRGAPVKRPQEMKPASSPGKNGETLVSFLYYLRETNQDRFDDVEAALKVAFPDFDCLRFPPVAAGLLCLTWHDRKFTKPLYLHELSEGTLRFLWLVALLQVPDPPTVTMIDEPETSLHPELMNLLADLLREASARTQLLVTTHSGDFVRFLRSDETLCLELDEEGGAAAVWADGLDIEKWLEDYSLAEVWRQGGLRRSQP